MCFTFIENNIRVITPQTFSGLPNLDILDLSQNKLDDESFSQNPLSVSHTQLCVSTFTPSHCCPPSFICKCIRHAVTFIITINTLKSDVQKAPSSSSQDLICHDFFIIYKSKYRLITFISMPKYSHIQHIRLKLHYQHSYTRLSENTNTNSGFAP